MNWDVKPKKKKLIAERGNVNWKYHEKVMDNIAQGDVIGCNEEHFFEALTYVPNRVIQRWITSMKKQIAYIERQERIAIQDAKERIAEEDANIQRVDAQVKGVKW